MESIYETIRRVKEWGLDWGQSIEEQVVEAGLARAKLAILAGEYDREHGHIDVSVPITVKLRFALMGDEVVLAPEGAAALCSCVWHPYSGGGGACVCTGPGAGDPSCDCTAPIA
ncbi:hypothetical protein OSH11_11565 [Kaistia dalseonensis]|uniref:Uncharacterized protein n=1 Tax=Kaistia dalseonensis TaxID=410840 RepID=A0ABU0H6J3_9HYPH|nr:hypothetical protein [Kaistia dalseonensis]MCX5495347.1 hypothetical protein [Kaistia dalseonensis]MDQ0437933.1 hypothetical protein [Kaistia dalseonensis]